MKLNLGCGRTHNEGYVNIDIDESLTPKPDLVMDFSENRLPYESGSVDEVTILHTIEHIHREKHTLVIGEINRVLKINGELIVAYPDAEKILPNFLENYRGMRYKYWEMTVLGRALSIWDAHRCLMVTGDLLAFLNEYGFGDFKVIPEVGQPHNTVVQAVKKFNTVERTELFRREVIQDAVL